MCLQTMFWIVVYEDVCWEYFFWLWPQLLWTQLATLSTIGFVFSPEQKELTLVQTLLTWSLLSKD